MKKYEIISPPFSLDFKNMSKKELQGYYEWYISIIPERLDILTNTVKSTNGHEDWIPDFTPESLDELGQFFFENVETRKKTKKEIKNIYNNAPDWFKNVEVDDWELSDRTFSLAIDIGIYLSQVFIKNHSELSWKHVLKGRKDYISYGQPVLNGFGSDEFDPTNICITLAYGLARKNKTSKRLRELYDTWTRFIP